MTPPAMPAPSLEALRSLSERAEIALTNLCEGKYAGSNALRDAYSEASSAFKDAAVNYVRHLLTTPEAEPGRLDREAVAPTWVEKRRNVWVYGDELASVRIYRASNQLSGWIVTFRDGRTFTTDTLEEGKTYAEGFIRRHALALTQPSRPSGETGGEAALAVHLRQLITYARWQLNEETRYHPTLRSAVAAAEAALATAPPSATQLEAENKFLLEAMRTLAKVVPTAAPDAGKEAGVPDQYTKRSKADLLAEIGRRLTAVGGRFPNYAYLDVCLPAGHWRAVLADAAASPPQPGTVAGWQPIETAPKDGTSFLATDCTTPIRTWVASWHLREFVCGGRYESRIEGLTHWMPLPAAPARGVGGEA